MKRFFYVLVSFVAIAVIGCSAAVNKLSEGSTSSKIVASGVVATGAPVSGAHLIIKDATGLVLGEADSDNTGYFELTSLKVGTSPYMVQAIGKDALGQTITLYTICDASYFVDKEIVNVNPITNSIAACRGCC